MIGHSDLAERVLAVIGFLGIAAGYVWWRRESRREQLDVEWATFNRAMQR